MDAPKGFQRFTLNDRFRFPDRWLWATHYKKIRGGFEYWRESAPEIVERETKRYGFTIITIREIGVKSCIR